uniref:PX domain-containing protein n=1 Tax=Globodera rostochiensis TaxID=31243 RepID=A0A914HKD8_GLORO
MYSLLPDETGCRSVLGTLVYLERKNFGFSAKVVDVTVPTNRFFGHVDRYKELSALYSTLSTIHRQLYLKGKCPPFAEPKYFGATDSQTVAERRDSIECFLQFVLNNEVLCKSVKFQQFLESAKEIEEVVEEQTKKSDAAEAEELPAEPTKKDIAATKQFE